MTYIMTYIMRLLLICLFEALSCAAAFAQEEGRKCPTCPGSGYNENFNNKLPSERVRESAARAVPAVLKNGYSVPYWTRGILQTYAGVVSRPWLKFDAINQQLYSRSAADEPEAVNMANLRAFAVGDSLSGTRHVYRRYLNARLENAALRTAFFEVRYDAGRTTLLCHRVVAERVAHRHGSADRSERATYFLKEPNSNLLVPVALNQKAVLAALKPVHRSALAAYAGAKSLQLKRESDVIRLLAYYDAL